MSKEVKLCQRTKHTTFSPVRPEANAQKLLSRRFQIPVNCVILVKMQLPPVLGRCGRKGYTMKRTIRQTLSALAVLAAALLGFALRCWQLGPGRDIVGRLKAGHPSGTVLAVFCALAVVALAVLSRQLKAKEIYTDAFSSGAPEMAVSAAAAVLLVFSAALSLMTERSWVQIFIGALGLLSGLCIAVTAAQRFRGVVPPLAMHIIPCVYLAARLIVIFKRWSVDPVVQDYCYNLFASISTMCAVYHLGGFCLNQGQRRLSAFWCLAGVVFSAVALPGPGNAQRLFYGAMLLWCGANAWQLLED